MGDERKENSNSEDHKIHKTHFPVVKVPLKNTQQESDHEWVKTGEGRWKRLPRLPLNRSSEGKK